MDRIGKIRELYGSKIALRALQLEAIKLNVKDPFLWASGYRMPIYNDNRRLLASAEVRQTIAEGFSEIIGALEIDVDNIAGTSTAGIPHATTLADLINKPLSYVRSSEKDHGLHNVIEGLGSDGSYHHQKVVLIEDLFSTGGSSIKAINAIRAAEGEINYCLAIFTYGLKASIDAFNNLTPLCIPITLLDYESLVATALEEGYVKEEEAKILAKWKEDPFNWAKGL